MLKTSGKARRSKKGILSMLKPKRERGIEIKPKRARVIGIFSCKGGVGKTTTAVNVGVYLTKHLKRGEVLAVTPTSAHRTWACTSAN